MGELRILKLLFVEFLLFEFLDEFFFWGGASCYITIAVTWVSFFVFHNIGIATKFRFRESRVIA